MDKFITNFVRLEAGKWTCVRSGEFDGPNGRIQVSAGSTFTQGTRFMGFDLAGTLEEFYQHGRKRH